MLVTYQAGEFEIFVGATGGFVKRNPKSSGGGSECFLAQVAFGRDAAESARHADLPIARGEVADLLSECDRQAGAIGVGWQSAHLRHALRSGGHSSRRAGAAGRAAAEGSSS